MVRQQLASGLHHNPVSSGIYMAEPFYTLLARDIEFGNITAYKDIELQFKLIYDNTFDPETKLLKHGYFDPNAPAEVARPVWADPTTGQCPHVWNRAVGWYMMALADLLIGPDAIPPWTSAYWTLLKQYQQLVPALVDNADPATGAWWLILTAVGQPGNYLESSGTAMFVYSMLRGIASGLIPDPKKTIRKAAIKAYEWLGNEMVIENVDGTLSWNGTVNVGSLGSNGTFEYYISRVRKAKRSWMSRLAHTLFAAHRAQRLERQRSLRIGITRV